MNSSEDIKSWIGKSIKNEDYISDFPVKAMSSVFPNLLRGILDEMFSICLLSKLSVIFV